MIPVTRILPVFERGQTRSPEPTEEGGADEVRAPSQPRRVRRGQGSTGQDLVDFGHEVGNSGGLGTKAQNAFIALGHVEHDAKGAAAVASQGKK